MSDRTVSYRFTGNFTGLTAGLTAAGRSTAELGAKMTALDKNGAKMRAGLTTLGSTAGKFGLVAAAGIGAFVVTAAKFESAMSRAGAATQATAGEMEELRKAALKAGADTIFSASEAADGITELGKAGLSTSDILGGALAGALNLAAAGQISVAEASETTAITLQQYGLAGDQASHVSDVLAASAGKAIGSVSDMSAALKYVGPVAAQMGISLEQSAGAIAELAAQGVIGEQAGTSLRGMLTSLTSPSKMASDQMDALGISLYDASGEFVGLDGVAQQLQDSMGGLSAAERDQALGRIFGNEQITAARILYSGGAADVQKWTNAVDDTGYAAKQAAQLTDSLAGDLEQLKGSLETALIGAGTGSQGPIRQLTQGLTAAVNEFNKLPSSAQNATTALLGITAVTGGSLWFGSKVINGIADTKEALRALNAEALASRTALTGIGAGVNFAVILGGIWAVDKALDKVFGDRSIDGGTLARDLAALSDGRAVNGLDEIGRSVRDVNSSLGETTDKVFGWLPGDTTFGEAKDNIDKIDEALAQMVESGNADQAASAMAEIVAQSKAQGISLAETTKWFDQYNLAQANASRDGGPFAAMMDRASAGLLSQVAAGKEATFANSDYGVAARQAASASQAEADALNDATKAMQDKRDATLAAFDAETGYRQALKDAQAQADKSNAGIRGNSDEVLANRSALSQLSSAWNNQSNAVKNNIGRFQEARKSFIDTATAMGVPIDQARQLAKRLLEIPKSTVAKVEAETDQAMHAVSSLGDMLSRLDGRVARTYIETIQRGYSTKRDNMASSLAYAAGGHVETSAPTALPAYLTGHVA